MDVLEAVADPVRRRILELLLVGETPAGVLAEAFPVSRPAVSRHLRVLREAGLVQVRVVGQQRVYRLDRRPLAAIERWLEQFHVSSANTVATVETVDRRASGAVHPSPASRLDALGTELRRGRRAGADERRLDERDDRDAAAG